MAPVFSHDTIPEKPPTEVWEEIRDSRTSALTGDIFNDSVPAPYSREELQEREKLFVDGLREDLKDADLNMRFSTFIISAEYYYLSRALIEKGMAPAFTLKDALVRYEKRLLKMRKRLSKQPDIYSLITILQAYAENKYYPGNGSGLLLDGLYHNLNDCEGGTKEVLAYLDDLYPQLEIGSNRGLLRTTSGDVIGHMQVYIAPGKVAGKIMENSNGIVLETTRVAADSIRSWKAGDVFPLEDFVFRFYPALSELADSRRWIQNEKNSSETGRFQKIVGTSNHPLKMSYTVSSTLLGGLYDIENIRRRKIENEFVKSRLSTCDPGIDPLHSNSSNIFSNFVAVDKKLRKNLIGHYLASLQYWDNQVMPQWKKPRFLVSYDDFATTLLQKKWNNSGYILLDSGSALPAEQVESHRLFLGALTGETRKKGADENYFGKGARQCGRGAFLSGDLVSYLFSSPEKPGFFFLPAVKDMENWENLPKAILDDCLMVTTEDDTANILRILGETAASQRISFRRMLYDRVVGRSPVAFSGNLPQDSLKRELGTLFTGRAEIEDATFAGTRVSGRSSREVASVLETVREKGRTGIAPELLRDSFDFFDGRQFMDMVLAYGMRKDLALSFPRANNFVETVVTLFLSGTSSVADKELEEVFIRLEGSEKENLRLAAIRGRALSIGKDTTELSAALASALVTGKQFDFEALLTLMAFGLREEDAVRVSRLWSKKIFSRIPQFPGDRRDEDVAVLLELAGLVRSASFFHDRELLQSIRTELEGSLAGDFRRASGDGPGGGDYGLLVSKVYILAMLAEAGTFMPADSNFLEHFITFGGHNPLGNSMVTLVSGLFSREALAELLQRTIDDQLQTVVRLSLETKNIQEKSYSEKLARLQRIVGNGNLIARLLLELDGPAMTGISGLPASEFTNRSDNGLWYLQKLHTEIGRTGIFAAFQKDRTSRSEKKNGFSGFAGKYYQDRRVRESFSLLAYFQSEKGLGKRVKFRKIKDIKTLKDLLKVKVIQSSRKVTRQDMSLLTLSLNGQNSSSEIRKSWEETLEVINHHLGLPMSDESREYLFAPHYPYLVSNDSGFLYNPDKIEDLRNAVGWGGRNDILLSSYLHFRNLPEKLPDWLLQTAQKRSEVEQAIIQRLEQRSFYPMILECESDSTLLPESLFSAKWKIRKPFGEDIFPGTLLLLRLGYLEITGDGELVPTKKMVHQG
ncbi:hypothetical protein DGMP_36220 [Desulfomarina profundi]|uniref:Uncharacterized protein n=1 Tax=Desulfomarina profundi TaxID=2772557 RepID=A0A8D5JIQ0_9BACT|nr:hypothetical protein [Desulfomarina profundi]BCL62929.1 hypothetical protein DGMP_36220 [Desulfomarina profundi]